MGQGESCLTQGNDAFLMLDLGKNVYPLGKDPKVDCTLYLACEDLFQTADAEVSITVSGNRRIATGPVA